MLPWRWAGRKVDCGGLGSRGRDEIGVAAGVSRGRVEMAGKTNTGVPMRTSGTEGVSGCGVVFAIACVMLVSVGLSADGEIATTRPASTTMASKSPVTLDARYDKARAELTIQLSNDGQVPVKIDGDLIFGMQISGTGQDGPDPWEALPSSREAAPRSPRVIELAPGKTVGRIVTLREGFDYFVGVRGLIRMGDGFVDKTTAYYARHRLRAPLPARISVTYDCRDRILRDGFTFLVGKTPESLGLELGPAGPVVVDLEQGTMPTKPANTKDGASAQPLRRSAGPGAESEASKIGAGLLTLIQASAQDEGLTRFIGKRAAFEGGTAPPGGNADLMVAEGVRLHVLIIPYRDVRPQAVCWNASVVGVITAVDAKKKVITVQAKSEDFVVLETW